MEKQNYLGIYISKRSATVICLGSQDQGRGAVKCFSVSVEDQQEQSPQKLADLIAKGCAERQLNSSDVAVALDCSMFMQHNVHSEFTDYKQIASTVRFDTEEALATDVTDIAIAFDITSTDQTGSNLTVFTAQRKILSDILLALQANNLDPVTIEPDAYCLSRFVSRRLSSQESEKTGTFYGMLSRRSGYFITFTDSQKAPVFRTFLIGASQNRAQLLTRQVPVTTALIKTDEPINHLEFFDSTASVNSQHLNETLGIEAKALNLAESADVDSQTLADCADPVEFAIAYGAALACLEKTQTVNFRNDFNPYQGKKLRLQKTLKLLSIAATVLLFTLGVYFQLPLFRTNKNRARLGEKLAEQYAAVMPGSKRAPSRASAVVKRLGGELRRIKDVKSGQLSASGEQSISAKLTQVLEALNECAAQTKLNIESISITGKDIRIIGDTSNSGNTLKLFKAINDRMEISSQEFGADRGRNKFSIAVIPKK